MSFIRAFLPPKYTLFSNFTLSVLNVDLLLKIPVQPEATLLKTSVFFFFKAYSRNYETGVTGRLVLRIMSKLNFTCKTGGDSPLNPGTGNSAEKSLMIWSPSAARLKLFVAFQLPREQTETWLTPSLLASKSEPGRNDK